MNSRYDAIIVGSGLGGLSAAASMAKEGLKVNVLEKHTQPGGYATSFFKDRFEFEVSLHALSGIGTPDEPGPLYRQLEEMDVVRRVDFIPIDDLYRSVAPDMDFVAPKGPTAFKSALVEAFPSEARGMERFVNQILTIGYEVDALREGEYSRAPVPTLARFPNLAHAAGVTVDTVLNRVISDPKAKLALSQLWGYFGLPPSKLSFLMFAVGMNAYLQYGASGIRGRSQSLSNAFVDVIRESGGEAHFSCGVEKIICKNGEVKGVVTEHGDVFESDQVVSNANPISTLSELMNEEEVPRGLVAHLKKQPPSLSAVTVYAGLSKPSRELGVKDYEIYMNQTLDMDRQFEDSATLTAPSYLSMCAFDLINPDAAPRGAGAISATVLSDGRAWQGLNADGYARAKDTIAMQMMDQVERLFPGTKADIETVSVSTPITNMRYTGNPAGAIYGFANTPKLNPGFRLPNQGPIKGLWFAGAWTQPGGGFQATIASGINTARAVLDERTESGRKTIRHKPAANPNIQKPPGYRSRKLRGLGLILRDGRQVKETIKSKYEKYPEAPPPNQSGTSVEEITNRFHARYARAYLKDRIRETEDTVTLRFESPSGTFPPFVAGQYFNFYVSKNGSRIGRPYSISSPPFIRTHLDITVKTKADGYISTYLARELRVGDSVECKGPNGDFFPSPLRDTEEMVGVAVGSGITPFMSMIEQWHRSGSDRKLILFYGSRTRKDAIFFERIHRLARTNPRLTFVPVLSKPEPNWDGGQGRINAELIRRTIRDSALLSKTFFICGPQEMYESITTELIEMGVERRRIRLEAYGPPNDITADPKWPSGVNKSQTFSVHFNGLPKSITAPAGEPLLNSLEKAGVHQSALCRSGVCDSCKVQIIKGTLFTPTVGEPIPTSNGENQIKPCMCYPLSDIALVG